MNKKDEAEEGINLCSYARTVRRTDKRRSVTLRHLFANTATLVPLSDTCSIARVSTRKRQSHARLKLHRAHLHITVRARGTIVATLHIHTNCNIVSETRKGHKAPALHSAGDGPSFQLSVPPPRTRCVTRQRSVSPAGIHDHPLTLHRTPAKFLYNTEQT